MKDLRARIEALPHGLVQMYGCMLEVVPLGEVLRLIDKAQAVESSTAEPSESDEEFARQIEAMDREGKGHQSGAVAESPGAAGIDRARFEAFWRFSRASKGKGTVEYSLTRTAPDGDYVAEHTQRHWWTWQNAQLNGSVPAASGNTATARSDDKTTPGVTP